MLNSNTIFFFIFFKFEFGIMVLDGLADAQMTSNCLEEVANLLGDMGRLTELERGCYRCEDPIVTRVSLWPLALSSSLFGRFYFMHSLRSKILHRSIKKMSEIFWKWKKLEQLFENFWDFFRSKNFRFFSKIFIGICMKMKNFEIENFRKISISIFFIFIQFPMKILKFLRSKISIFFDLKNFHFHTNSNENFRKNRFFSISKIFKIFRKFPISKNLKIYEKLL